MAPHFDMLVCQDKRFSSVVPFDECHSIIRGCGCLEKREPKNHSGFILDNVGVVDAQLRQLFTRLTK